jgi:hypothetical protein
MVQATKRWLAATPPNMEETVTSIDRVIRDSRGADQTMQHIRVLFRRDTFEKKEASLFEILNEAVRLVQEDSTKRRVTVESEIGKELSKISVGPHTSPGGLSQLDYEYNGGNGSQSS